MLEEASNQCITLFQDEK